MNIRDAIRQSKLYYFLGDPIYKLKGRFYDLRHQVLTAPEMPIRAHTISGPNGNSGAKYAGTEPRYFRKVLAELDLDFERYTFIDFGSGMGRALLLASESPFKRIVGVEFSKELHEIAVKNIAAFRSPARKCARVESVWQDAVAYPLPPEPSVFYLFNPFTPEMFAKFLANVERSLTEHPREVYLIYANPAHNNIFAASSFFDQIATGPWHTVHKAIS